MADIFLSYKKIDRARATLLVAALEAEGFSIWWDYELESGDKWLERIVDEVGRARCLVGYWAGNALTAEKLFTPSSEDGTNYLEIEHRKAGRRRVIGAMMDVGAVPLHYADIQVADLSTWGPESADHSGFGELVTQICRLATPRAVAVRMREAELDLERERVNFTTARSEIRLLSQKLEREQQASAALRLELDRIAQQPPDEEGERRQPAEPEQIVGEVGPASTGHRFAQVFGSFPRLLTLTALFATGLLVDRYAFPPDPVQAPAAVQALSSTVSPKLKADCDAEIVAAKTQMLADPASAIERAQKIALLAGYMPDGGLRRQTLATADWLAGEANVRINALEKAGPLLNEALALTATTRPTKLRGDVLLSQGGYQTEKGDFAAAQSSYMEAHNIYRDLGESRSRAITLVSIALLYLEAKDDANADRYFAQARDVYQGDPAFNLTLHQNRGVALLDQERYTEAKTEFAAALSVARQMGTAILQARALIGMANVDIKTGQIASADVAVASVVALARKSGALALQREGSAMAAKLAFQRGDLASAVRLITQAFDGVDIGSTGWELKSAHQYAYEIFSKAEQPKLALVHLEALKSLEDRSSELARSASAAFASARFDYANQELRIAKLSRDEARRDAEFQSAHNRTLVLALIGVILLAAMLAGCIAIWRRRLEEILFKARSIIDGFRRYAGRLPHHLATRWARWPLG